MGEEERIDLFFNNNTNIVNQIIEERQKQIDKVDIIVEFMSNYFEEKKQNDEKVGGINMEHIIDGLIRILKADVSGAAWDSNIYDDFADLIQSLHKYVSDEAFSKDGMSEQTLKVFSQLSVEASEELQDIYAYYKELSASPNLINLLYTSIAFFKVNVNRAKDYATELDEMVVELSGRMIHR